MKKQILKILWIAIASSILCGCATGCFDLFTNESYSHLSTEFSLGQTTPLADVGDDNSLRLEKVMADGSVMLKSTRDGRDITCKVGEQVAFGPGKSYIELLTSDAQKQTAKIRMERIVPLRIAGP